MPELPDVELYVDALRRFTQGRPLEKVRLASPFLVRSIDPPIHAVEGRRVVTVRRLGKRIVMELDGDLHLVLHLMIAGRLRLKDRGARVPGKVGLAAFDFPDGTLILTEASTRKRASLHLVAGRAGLAAHDRGGLEPLDCTQHELAEVLRSESHTLKRSLTDPRLLSGIGNAYSDEILHRARLSPVKLTRRLDDAEIARLHGAMQEALTEWRDRLRTELGDGFPDKVTAFRDGMAVHGRYGKPCPVCDTPVQRIVHAENESNYCPRCQTGGKLLADRALSRLLGKDWPRSLEELEERRREGR